ncbi:HAD hydrolase-like protein [Promethearchaeum syntrophicum]|uniref:HAD hydrolase-like protein n=1 Tax=Promethearchaeum syntrophicum TaxID=2594042 RepID=A0A5B9DBW8_9ARCH|nr:HAD hydrolase-like protein [Candidatus Prometheoarchaeum syntrophicum]
MTAPSDWLILFDDGNVLNDNNVRGFKFQQVLGDYMMEHYGGEKQRWIEININYIEKFMKEFFQIVDRGGVHDFNNYFRSHMINWGKSLFSGYNLAIPSNSSLLDFFHKTVEKIAPLAAAPPRGIIEVLKSLSNQGYLMCTSSGETSFELHGYLLGMNANQYFNTLYGPDLLNCGKFSSTFYSKILTINNRTAKYTIVIDDNPKFLQMAHEIGINTIQSNSCLSNRAQSEYADYKYENSTELLPIISQITGNSLV